MTEQAEIYSRLKDAINKIPLVDNHAHNLLQSFEPSPDFPRETLVSVAEGEALSDSIYSLAHIRMLRHLARFNLPIDSSWQDIIDAAQAKDYASLCRDFIQAAGIQAILIDDGIQNDYTHAISWHDQLTPTPNKRIVQIETLFESIVAQSGREKAFVDFPAAIRKLVNDPEVVGFNSIAAYRSGLDIQPLDSEKLSTKWDVAHREVRDYPPGRFRVKQHGILTWVINATCCAISGHGKPLQFHTGLGDNDTTLTKADASLLQPLIKAYPKVPFVLLHSGYPYARQAGYLATVYSNVYLDFGLAIPLLSGDGQRNLIRQLLELCPTNKLLWSSNTTFHPERFYLTAVQTREGLTEVLTDYIRRNEIGFDEAIQVAKRMLFENANKLYKLGIEYIELGSEKDIETETMTAIIKPPSPVELPKANIPDAPPPEVPRPSQVGKKTDKKISTLIEKLKSQDIKFVRIAWVDHVNFTRYRVVSIEHLDKFVGSQLLSASPSTSSEQLAESGVSVAKATLGLQAKERITPGVSASGDHELKPDFSTAWNASFAPGHAYMMGRFFHRAHIGGRELETCPRTILQRVVQRAEKELGVKFSVGFGTEFALLAKNGGLVSTEAREPQCGPVNNCVHEMAQCVVGAGIKLETYHVGSVGGQYEIVTEPVSPTQAADALVATREIIYNVARKHDLRATLCPSAIYGQAHIASRIHVFVESTSSDTPSSHPDIPTLPKDLAAFMAGLLSHLVSVCMFTLPADVSYVRPGYGVWSGRVWVCWGQENNETPVRLCGSEQGRFNVEVKAFDGMANPYLALAAVLGAGITGLKNQAVLEMRECQVAASKLTENQRREMRITTKMPTQNAVFEPGLDERMGFIDTWLPEEAWKLYKDVREVILARYFC